MCDAQKLSFGSAVERPFLSFSIQALEDEFKRAVRAGDAKALGHLRSELENRSTRRAKDLLKELEAQGEKQNPAPSPAALRNQNTPTSTRTKKSNPAQPSLKFFRPTPEQEKAIELFSRGGSLKVNAYAGAGKTSTLTLLADRTSRYGQYIAFNKAIVKEAREKFPLGVDCSTLHGLAFKATPSEFKTDIKKMTGKVNAHELAQILNLKSWQVDSKHVLKPHSIASLFAETVRRFAQSGDAEPMTKHVARHGSLLSASAETLRTVEETAVKFAKHLWQRMTTSADPLPLGHDGYLKRWALGSPVIAADYILLDEAQDTNPVVLDVLAKQPSQMVYVGDKYQQIYEWRGAVNAMDTIATDHTTSLTMSFRFGDRIAHAASKVLQLLGEAERIHGNPALESRIGPVTPNAILARSNANAIAATIDCLDQGRLPHLVGGNGEMVEMLRGVQDLKSGQQSTVPEFFGFQNWTEVVEFARSGDGQDLLAFVNLVEARGEKQLLWAISRTVDEERCDVVISTAHKAKGREWRYVRLMDDFLKSKDTSTAKPANTSKGHDPAELRLFYVALTRAKLGVEVPEPVLRLIGA